MVIKSENVTFKKDFSTSGEGAPTQKEMGVAATKEEVSDITIPEGIEPGTLDELQFLMAEISRYGGKGTSEGVSVLIQLLVKTAADFLSGVIDQDSLGAALASVILLAEEKGYSIDAIAHYKLTKMVST